MPNLIVSTCGTSFFTNTLSKSANSADMREKLIRHANTATQNDMPADVVEHVQQASKQLAVTTDLASLVKGSAELAGLAAFYGNTLRAQHGADHHILLSTDTWLGERSAEVIAAVLQHHGHGTEVRRCRDMRTNDIHAYRTALSEVVKWAYETLPGYKAKAYKVIFNLTGGFKAVQGFMQTLGALHADECVYVFERSNELIRLPRLPIQMQAQPWVRDNLVAFRRMSLSLAVSESEVANVPEILLLLSDGQASMSEWGELVWNELQPSLYAETLHPSPSSRLTWEAGFERSLRQLDPKRMEQINLKIDALARYLETEQALQSLDFKTIKGGPIQGSTHEIDAWADGSAMRIFGHHTADKRQFVLDRLDHALH